MVCGLQHLTFTLKVTDGWILIFYLRNSKQVASRAFHSAFESADESFMKTNHLTSSMILLSCQAVCLNNGPGRVLFTKVGTARQRVFLIAITSIENEVVLHQGAANK